VRGVRGGVDAGEEWWLTVMEGFLGGVEGSTLATTTTGDMEGWREGSRRAGMGGSESDSSAGEREVVSLGARDELRYKDPSSDSFLRLSRDALDASISFRFFALTLSRRERLDSRRNLADKGGVSRGDSRGLLVMTLTSRGLAPPRARLLRSEAEFRVEAEPGTRIMGMALATFTLGAVEALVLDPTVLDVLDRVRPENVAARASACVAEAGIF